MDLSGNSYRATKDGFVFATCPWCGWHLHQLPAVPAVGFLALLMRCERRQCGRSYILLLEVRPVETTYRLRVVGEKKLLGHDSASIHRALDSFHVMNEDELRAAETIIALWLEQAEGRMVRRRSA